MAGYSRSAALRKVLHIEAQTPVINRRPIFADPFTESDWRTEQQIRELLDFLLIPVRYKVTWLPPDGRARYFYLRGSHAQVSARATQFFPSGSFALEPAPVQNAPEVIDKALNHFGRTP